MLERENKFKVGDLVSYTECGLWWHDGVVIRYSRNCAGRKLVEVRDSHGSNLVFYEHEVTFRKEEENKEE